MNTSPPASNVLKFRLSNATDKSNTNTTGNESVCAQKEEDKTNYELLNRMKNVASWGELSWFIVALKEDHEENPDQWNNYDLYPFLEAMNIYLAERSWDESKPIPEDQPWKTFAEILYAAKIYE